MIDSRFFDEIHDRRMPGDIKYEPVEGVEDLIPMWIADMDFKCAPAIEEALKTGASRGIFGYMEPDSEYDQAVIDWYGSRFGWKIEAEDIIKMPSVMFGVACAVRALTEPGDAALIFQPVYYPFKEVIESNGRRTVVSELKLENGRYEIDYLDFERKISENGVKLLVLCSPHNPVGRVWTERELMKLLDLCLGYGVCVISDEIHSDFVYPGSKHTPFATLSKDAATHCITCTSPTKTFNIAGLQVSNIIVSDPIVRRKVFDAMAATGYFEVNNLSIYALKAAYREGGEWLAELLKYLKGNIDLIRTIGERTGGKIKLIEPEGTYLLWLDCREMGLDDEALYDWFIHKTGIRLHKGSTFGRSGSGFMRMNVACPRSVIEEVLRRIEAQFKA